MGTAAKGNWAAPSVSAAIAAALAAITAVAAVFSASFYWRRSRRLASRIQELEASLKASLDKTAAERRGRTRAQQALRESLLKNQIARDADEASTVTGSYPMMPIGTVRSCFTSRNGTPRQPLIVPLARACLVLNPSHIQADALEGLADYSHCWILYVFHLNTDLEKLWKQSSRSKFKAKVRVPRLKGGKMGVFATRSPHRPCPIGLTVAKVEAVDGRAILLSGVDLVDGTPVLDVKPYLRYSDCIEEATVPKWLEEDNTLITSSVTFSSNFSSSLANCWVTAGTSSMYSSPEEFTCLIKQVLSWDIRSFVQRSRPHLVGSISVNDEDEEFISPSGDSNSCTDFPSSLHQGSDLNGNIPPSSSVEDVAYHLVLEGINVTYRIDADCNVVVEKATFYGKNGVHPLQSVNKKIQPH